MFTVIVILYQGILTLLKVHAIVQTYNIILVKANSPHGPELPHFSPFSPVYSFTGQELGCHLQTEDKSTQWGVPKSMT